MALDCPASTGWNGGRSIIQIEESPLQFDNTRIAIRERSFLDLLDLALLVIRRHAGPLLAALAAGAAPMVLLNTVLLGGFVEVITGDSLSDTGDETAAAAFGYAMTVAMLVVWEMPLATSLVTLYLGAAMFDERPRARQIVRDFGRSLPQLVLFQVLLRGLLVPLVVTWFIPFAIWPYLNEVILLDRNPLRRRAAGGLTTWSRSSNLHSANSGELFGRWLMSALVGTCWLAAIWLSMWFIRSRLLNQPEFDWLMLTVGLQLAIWLVVGYFTVVRYLGYLDLRIKSEGWEIELRMRAEATKLARVWR
jgi:hypothetical protein